MNYYNENDPRKAAWLLQLIGAKLIPKGEVDDRSIKEVTAADLKGFIQCHFFAGIGGWAYALALAGWPANRHCWTGSCPCQPFSVAGKGRGRRDARHLWPVWARLIEQCRPATIFGEQVASKAGRLWLAGIFADLEVMAYQKAAADLCAAGVSSPQIRQRLFWVGYADRGRLGSIHRKAEPLADALQSSFSNRLAHAARSRIDRGYDHETKLRPSQTKKSGERCKAFRLGNPNGARRREQSGIITVSQKQLATKLRSAFGRKWRGGAWNNYEILKCLDKKTRRIESGSFPLAHGLPGRVGLLRGYGDAIVPLVAAEFIQAFKEAVRR